MRPTHFSIPDLRGPGPDRYRSSWYRIVHGWAGHSLQATPTIWAETNLAPRVPPGRTIFRKPTSTQPILGL